VCTCEPPWTASATSSSPGSALTSASVTCRAAAQAGSREAVASTANTSRGRTGVPASAGGSAWPSTESSAAGADATVVAAVVATVRNRASMPPVRTDAGGAGGDASSGTRMKFDLSVIAISGAGAIDPSGYNVAASSVRLYQLAALLPGVMRAPEGQCHLGVGSLFLQSQHTGRTRARSATDKGRAGASHVDGTTLVWPSMTAARISPYNEAQGAGDAPMPDPLPASRPEKPDQRQFQIRLLGAQS